MWHTDETTVTFSDWFLQCFFFFVNELKWLFFLLYSCSVYKVVRRTVSSAPFYLTWWTVRQTTTIVIISVLCLILLYDHLHPVISPGCNWTQMWSLFDAEFWHRFERLCRFLFRQPCQSLIWIHVLGQLWCEVRSLAKEKWERWREGAVLLTSQHTDTVIWSNNLSSCDRFMCDMLYILRAFVYVWSEGECVLSENWYQVEKQNNIRK